MKHTAHGYWLEEAGEAEQAPRLVGEHSADVVVVGGGFTGMWAAWLAKELEPEARVVLLEAGICGHGPSGRNGGFCNVMWFALPNMRSRWGDAAALAVARAAERAVAEVGLFCEDEGVDAWFRHAGYLQVSTAAAHDDAWAETRRRLPRARRGRRDPGARRPMRWRGAAPRRSSAAAPSTPTRPPCSRPGWRSASATRLRAAGVELYESSPVTRVVDGSGAVEVRTPGGAVRAGTAILAVGAAAKAPRGPLRNALTVTSSHIVLTEPVPDLLEEIGWTGGECITDSRTLIDYFRTTPDGRIAFGWGGGRIAMGARLGGRAELDAEVVALVARHLRHVFPGLEGRRLTHAWGGPIDASPTHLPMVVPLPGGRAYAAAGYTGNGVGPSHMVGRTLASLALDRRDEYSRLAFVDPSPPRVPPSPSTGWEAKQSAEP